MSSGGLSLGGCFCWSWGKDSVARERRWFGVVWAVTERVGAVQGKAVYLEVCRLTGISF